VDLKESYVNVVIMSRKPNRKIIGLNTIKTGNVYVKGSVEVNNLLKIVYVKSKLLKLKKDISK